MKLDNIKMMTNNKNENASKSEDAKSNEDFFNIFQSKINKEEIKEETDICEKDLENMEEVLLQLINLIMEDKDQSKIVNIQNEESDTNSTKNALDNNLESYFQGNETNLKLLENILSNQELKKEELNIILDYFKEKQNINKNIDNIKSKYESNIKELPSTIEKVIDKLKNIEFSNIDKFYKNEKVDDFKINNIDYKLNNIKDKELSILKDIAKDDKSVFMISGDKNNIRADFNIANIGKSSPAEIRENFVVKDIVNNISYLESNNLKELKINLNPKELGAITIKIVKSSNETKVSIVVAKEEVFNLVNKNIQEISKHLEMLDIKVGEISVDIKSDNQNFLSDNLDSKFKDQNNQNKKNNKDEKSGSSESIEIDENTTNQEDNINLLA